MNGNLKYFGIIEVYMYVKFCETSRVFL